MALLLEIDDGADRVPAAELHVIVSVQQTQKIKTLNYYFRILTVKASPVANQNNLIKNTLLEFVSKISHK